MNPREDLEEATSATARAFVQMFSRYGEQFQFAIDPGTDSDEEVRAFLSGRNCDEKSTINVIAVNEQERFAAVKDGLEEMGVRILNSGQEENEHESVGEYTSYFLTATADHDPDAEWNVPHLVVYGSLTPEIEEACYAAFGSQYTYTNIRNHYLVFGDGLAERDRDSLVDAIRSSNEFFEEDSRDAISDVRTAEYI